MIPTAVRCAAALALVALPLAAGAPVPGDLDLTFNTTGFSVVDVTVNGDPRANSATGLALQSDGKVVMGGSASLIGAATGPERMILVRLNANGTLDNAFANMGRLRIDALPQADEGYYDGRVAIASVDESAARKAIAIIEELTATPELNKSYLGKVVRVVEFGAFVEILPGTDGLLHVSEMAHHRVNNVHDEVKEGDQVLVKVVSIDPSGKIRLSRKALLDEAQGGTPAAVAAGGGEGSGGHSHGDRPHASLDHPPRRREMLGQATYHQALGIAHFAPVDHEPLTRG